MRPQIRGLRLDEATVSAIVAAIAQPDQAVVPIDRGRMERRRRELALDVAAGRMSERAFRAALRRLNEEDAALVDPRPRRAADGAKAVEYIRNFAARWAKAKPPTKAAMTQSLYQEVVVPALPTWGGPRRGSNMALARPTGVGRALATYEIPIEGRDEWLAAAKRLA